MNKSIQQVLAAEALARSVSKKSNGAVNDPCKENDSEITDSKLISIKSTPQLSIPSSPKSAPSQFTENKTSAPSTPIQNKPANPETPPRTDLKLEWSKIPSNGSLTNSGPKLNSHRSTPKRKAVIINKTDDRPTPLRSKPLTTIVDKDTFHIQLLCEDGKILTKICAATDTLDILINKLQEDFPPELIKKIQFKIPGAGFLTNQYEQFADIPYFQNCKKRRDDPKFMLVFKGSEYHKAVKHDEVTIGSLLGRPLAWAQNDDENTSFRQCMARIRLQERRYVEQKAKDLNLTNSVPVNIGDGPIISDDKKVFVVLKLHDSQKKKVVATSVDTGDSFLKRNIKYFGIPEDENLKYLFKVVGKEEYFMGPHKFFDFEYIQRCSATNTEIYLSLKRRSDIEITKESGPYLFEKEEEFLSTDPVIKYDHESLAVANSLRNQPKDEEFDEVSEANAFKDMNLISVWDIEMQFRVKILGLENIIIKQPTKNMMVFVTMCIYCGDEEISPNQSTPQLPLEQNIRFGTYVTTQIKMADLPRSTKLCFTVYSIKKSGKKVKEPVALGWVNCLVFNYKNELNMGNVKLKMWPDEAARPIGTCVPNHTDNAATVLSLEFDIFENTVVFPTEPLKFNPDTTDTQLTNSDDRRLIEETIGRHSLGNLDPLEKLLLWKYRKACMKIPDALPKFLMAVNKVDRLAIQEMHSLLEQWAPIKPVDALELLDARYSDANLRNYAVKQLEKLCNADIEDYLLQLVQVLKYECYHDCALSRFLLKRAIRNKRISHYLYWFLKSEIHQPQVSERFRLLLEAFLKGGSTFRVDITAQERVQQTLIEIAFKAKEAKDPLLTVRTEIDKLNQNWPNGCQLMLDPGFLCKGIVSSKCKVMDSKMKPLWLLFENVDPQGENMNVIFKAGDDLRQDMLTLQMFRIMDKMWKREDLDLSLNPYSVIATGSQTGMIEVVTNSQTISKIQKKLAGATGAFRDEVLFEWLRQQNPEDKIKHAVEHFTSSCAGYCVATWVLGIGDRHNDNIMVKHDGHLFHIDFGHILGNFKKKLGIKRERVPFVFTPDFAYVMGGKKDSIFYSKFIENCIKAHEILRKNYKLFINLFTMMLISGMPELQTKDDIMYLVDTLSIETIASRAADSNFKDVLNATGKQWATRVNFFFHNIVH